MGRLIESELSLAQMSDKELPKEHVELPALLAEVQADLAPTLEQAGARLEIGTLTSVMADPRQLRLLFRNLVENALKHRGDAALVVRVEERDPADPARCVIVVSHNAHGFTTESAQRMFTIFNRTIDATTSTTGIGLAICRRIVERHGGRILAEGNPDSGAVFTIELPREGSGEDVGAVAS
jgi:signal transduction histidine kinase